MADDQTTESQDQTKSESTSIPLAKIREATSNGQLNTKLWWLTGICVAIAAILISLSFGNQGRPILIHFKDGYGLKPGDTLRFRGIDIGTVRTVGLASDLQGVDVVVLLAPGNESIAVAESQFWIERARLSLSGVTGLDTVLGAKYISVQPGADSGQPTYEFTGVETPLGFAEGESLNIEIAFPKGEGLVVGDPILFRGLKVGEVVEVGLRESLEGIVVDVRLTGHARQFAKVGTQFWIERPRLDLTEIRGLETLIGGRYIAVQPSSLDSQEQLQFDGLAEAPPLPLSDGTLEIELDAPDRLGLVRGAPVLYRGLEVGRIASVGLADDGSSVKVAAVIDRDYTSLVRDNSKFWVSGGLELDASLRGLNVSMNSLASWIRGGISFATPPAPGKTVVTGYRYMLEAEPQEEWLEWRPRIAISRGGITTDYPKPMRLVASWKASWLELSRRKTLESWATLLSDDRLVVSSEFIRETGDIDRPVLLEFGGKSFELPKSKAGSNAIKIPSLVTKSLQSRTWNASKTNSTWDPKAVLLVVNPELSEPSALDSSRLSKMESGNLKIAPGVSISPGLVGSPVIYADTGELFGVLGKSEDSLVIEVLK